MLEGNTSFADVWTLDAGGVVEYVESERPSIYFVSVRLRWGRFLRCEVVLLKKGLELSGLMHWETGHSFGKTEQLKNSLPRMMSQPPTNSPSTYSCGIVGHSLNDE